MYASWRVAALILAGLAATDAAGSAAAEIRDLPVPVRTIYPEELIAPSELASRRFATTRTSIVGIAVAVEDVAGKQAKRRLTPGKPIPLSAVTTPLAVHRGAAAAALFEENGISISTTLTALEDGKADDVIRARNMETGLVVKALVKADGTLAVAGTP